MKRPRKQSYPALSDLIYRYAVIDLASAPDLARIVMGRLGHEAQPLFAPSLHVDILSVGPWLVQLGHVPDLEPAIEAQYSDRPWGYFVETTVDIVSLRRALRRYNYVKIPSHDAPVLFRYWDPRVMHAFLSVATKEQFTVLFEFIDRLEGPAGMFNVKRPR